MPRPRARPVIPGPLLHNWPARIFFPITNRPAEICSCLSLDFNPPAGPFWHRPDDSPGSHCGSGPLLCSAAVLDCTLPFCGQQGEGRGLHGSSPLVSFRHRIFVTWFDICLVFFFPSETSISKSVHHFVDSV